MKARSASRAETVSRRVRTPMRRLRFALCSASIVLGVLVFVAAPAQAAPEVELHDLTWFVHIDLINPGAGEDLAYWQSVLDSAVATGNKLLEGRQGPVDQVCCTRLTRSLSVATFGTPGDGLDVVDSFAKQDAIASIGTGSRAFLVDSASYCSGPSAGAIGCAIRPSCTGNGDDDPNLWMYVTVDAFDDGTLGSVIPHERGHNTCLSHVSNAKCQLMQATVYTPGLGGCLLASECTSYRLGRTEFSSGVECSCHDDFSGVLDDGTICSEVATGVCSGGLCGEVMGDARVHLFAAGNSGDLGGAPQDAIRVSALSGDWTNLGQMAPTADDVRAMAYAEDSGTLYGVVPTVFDDSIVTMDPATGAILAFVGTIGNGAEEIVSMAYDPGATDAPTDDRLIVLEVGGSVGEFRSINPASPSTATLLGSLIWQPAGAFTGMAYDSIQDKLYLASPFGQNGLWETDLTSCPPSPCTTTQLPGSGFFRDDASLSYSRATGMLYLIGTSFGSPNTRTFYNVIDPATGTSVETLSLDRFTPSALAAVPEPGLATGITLGLLALGLIARRRLDPLA